MRFIEKITSHQNITQAIEQVKKNKGAPGVDEMTVDELDHYFYQHGHTLVQEIRSMTYRPKAVKEFISLNLMGSKDL
ncbi:hypothetical protein GCM10025857_65690 [Alicyclobacillus contaminans]|nr:hypothetical protein GCM10025857_65690 [Alicyclobacillus contaminans]